FSRGSNNNMLRPYGLRMTEGCELTRVALRNHKSPVSQVISAAIRMLKRKAEGLRLIVSYADPNEGHAGAIYQAGNWIYTGQTGKDFRAIDRSGREWHSRQVSRTGVKRQYGEARAVPRLEDCKIVPLEGKHRYLYPLDRAMRRQIAPLAKPYPKRAGG
ncbi:MAG: protein Mom, partial [Phycisphaerales bacterium]